MPRLRMISRIDPLWLQREMGKRLRVERNKRDLSAQVVADAIGVTRAAISNYELGNGSIALSKLYDLALFYKVPVSRLLP